jgi:hypothetical protein
MTPTNRPYRRYVIEFPLLPSGQPLPLAYRWIVAQDILEIHPWGFLDTEEIEWWRDRYTASAGKTIYPFAYNTDRMELAAFPVRCGSANGRVFIFDYDFDGNEEAAKRGNPGRPIKKFPSFQLWLRWVFDETFEYFMSEDILSGMLKIKNAGD